MSSVDFKVKTIDRIRGAMIDILNGDINRADISKDVKVYKCGTVMRIDLKIHEDEMFEY